MSRLSRDVLRLNPSRGVRGLARCENYAVQIPMTALEPVMHTPQSPG